MNKYMTVNGRNVNKPSVEYSIQHRASCGEWVDEGLYFDTYDEALVELKYQPGQPKEKYRIVEEHYTTVWERV